MVKLYTTINETATTNGFSLLPKQVSDLFQIETSYLRQNNQFSQSDISFPTSKEALFIADEHEPIAIGKDNAFKVISQVELASCL